MPKQALIMIDMQRGFLDHAQLHPHDVLRRDLARL